MSDYTTRPHSLGIFECNVEEYMLYTYLPIKLAGPQVQPVYEERLCVFDTMIGRACCDFIGEFGIDKYVASNVYLTAVHQYQPPGIGFNRPGWHTDGFGTNDITYIWSDRQPTIFNSGPFNLSDDDIKSMDEMEQQASPANNYTFPDGSLLRLDQYSVHKVADFVPGPRAFIKVCFSTDQYKLRGNSINHMLNYQWEYVDRLLTRNIPQLS